MSKSFFIVLIREGVKGSMENITNNSEVIKEPENIIRPVINSVDNTVFDPDNNITIYKCELREDGCIWGYTEDNTRAKYNYPDNKFYYGSNIGKSNLVSLACRTDEERRRFGSMGGLKAKENREREKNLKEIAQALLKATTGERQKKQILGENYEDTFGELKTNGEVMLARMILGAMDGSFKCAEFVRDTAGEKPKNEVEVSADIMTDADRALIEKLEKRTS